MYNLILGLLFGRHLFQNKINIHHSGHNEKADADAFYVNAKI